MKHIPLLILLLLLPQAVRAAWLEASSANFVVYADDSEKNLRRVSEQLELYHQAMERVTAHEVPDPSPSNRVVVYVVRNERQVQRLYGERRAGTAARAGDRSPGHWSAAAEYPPAAHDG